MRFWRDSGGGGSGGGRDLNGGGTPCGQVRVLVVGDSGQQVLLFMVASRYKYKVMPFICFRSGMVNW
jgi:hypothetical protein